MAASKSVVIGPGGARFTLTEAEAVTDPFKVERERLLADPDPCVRVCGRIADLYGVTAAQLLEQVREDEWVRWLQTKENADLFRHAGRLYRGRLEAEQRAIALAILTRRGQPGMLKVLASRTSDPERSPRQRTGAQPLVENPNPLHSLTVEEIRRIAGEDDEED